MPYNTAYGTRLGLSEHRDVMYGVKKAKSRTNRSSWTRQQATSTGVGQPRRNAREQKRWACIHQFSHPAQLSPCSFSVGDFAFKPQRLANSHFSRLESRRTSDDVILSPIPPNPPYHLDAGKESICRVKVPPWLTATCRMLSESHPLRKIVPLSPPTSKRASDCDIDLPASSLRSFHAENAPILENQQPSSAQHSTSVSSEQDKRPIYLRTHPPPSDYSPYESPLLPRYSPTLLQPGSRPPYSHRCTMAEPFVASHKNRSSRISHSPRQHASTTLPQSPIIDSTVTLMHPLAKRLSVFPTFDQQVSVSATPAREDFSVKCPIPWDTHQRKPVASCSDPVSDAVRVTQSFITPAIGASVSFPSRPSLPLSLESHLHLHKNDLPAGIRASIIDNPILRIFRSQPLLDSL